MLVSKTRSEWIDVALSDLDALLADHAHCEKKAAASALSLIAGYPDRDELADRVTDQNRRRLRLPFLPYAACLCATAVGAAASGSVLEESCQPIVVTLKTTSPSMPTSIHTVMMIPHAILLTPLLVTSSDDTEHTSISASFSINRRQHMSVSESDPSGGTAILSGAIDPQADALRC